VIEHLLYFNRSTRSVQSETESSWRASFVGQDPNPGS
jgi:hypothetical protein